MTRARTNEVDGLRIRLPAAAGGGRGGGWRRRKRRRHRKLAQHGAEEEEECVLVADVRRVQLGLARGLGGVGEGRQSRRAAEEACGRSEGRRDVPSDSTSSP